MKRSNYAVAKVEFSPDRIASHFGGKAFDAVIFEYWYAAEAADVFRRRSIPCILDMHNILWRAYERQLRERRWLPLWLRRIATERYRWREEQSWRRFDGLVTINREEEDYVRERSGPGAAHVFYAPMGLELERWPYRWNPASPARVGFYGGLGSPENQEGALRCHAEIMPRVWEAHPEAELWLIGSDPPARLRALTRDPRVRVTGYLPDVRETVSTMSCVVCPWSGTYGFRSRLIEVMSIGVPVVASPDAVSGMELEHGKGILLGADDAGLARLVLELLENDDLARRQSRLGRSRVEELFSFEKTYGRWMREMVAWIRRDKPIRASIGLRD